MGILNKLKHFVPKKAKLTQANIHDHSTRANNQLRTNQPHHEHAKYSIKHQIPKVINSTPMNILTKINTQPSGFQKVYQTYYYTVLQRNIYSIKLLHLFLILIIVYSSK